MKLFLDDETEIYDRILKETKLIDLTLRHSSLVIRLRVKNKKCRGKQKRNLENK